MKKIQFAMLLVVLGSFMTSAVVYAQKSPPAKAEGKVAGASISIAYSSPSVKGRKIWGELVPYGKAWRAGANEATIFQTDKDIKVEGKELKAGKYSLFIVPNEKEWEFIFNSETGQWGIKKGGDANYDPAKNAITFKVKPTKSASMTEQLTYVVTEKGFTVRWENMEASVAIK
jgi:hypothetical protein